MSHPVVVEAIEGEFVPLLIHNNKGGQDATILKQFGEPSWNNPVVRFLDANAKDVIARRDGVWTTTGIAGRMTAALAGAQRDVPFYLDAFVKSTSRPPATATFAMYCYWEGEAKLGSIEGVLATRSGWQSGLEVITVHYDPEVVDYRTLVTTAQQFSCATKVFAHDADQLQVAKQLVGERAVMLSPSRPTRDAKASDQKYYLSHTPLKHLPLTEVQATKLNAAVKARNGEYTKLLSPNQQGMLQAILVRQKTDPKAFDDLVYPADPNQLVNFETKLKARLR